MEILLWLAPAAVVTLTAMLWVAWWGRAGRGEIDRETAARRMGEALGRERRSRPGYAAPRPEPGRSTGVAVRRTRPVVVSATDDPGADQGSDQGSDPGSRPPAEPSGTDQPDRRAS